MINGVYDIIVKMTGPSTIDLEYFYFKIRHIDGFKTTLTLVRYSKKRIDRVLLFGTK